MSWPYARDCQNKVPNNVDCTIRVYRSFPTQGSSITPSDSVHALLPGGDAVMAFGAEVNEDNDWLQVEKGMDCLFCRESKPGSRRGSKSKKEKTAEARLANDYRGHYTHACSTCW